ncbi:MAG: UDP-galactopyranose mutase [Parachlamydiales bacterium]|nr:UDP-galactopyranose mutase [Parachlamydiales bacterium]
MQIDYLIVGAGFSGCVIAERLAREKSKSVLIIDKRSHIGGNAYDYYDESGILVHKYGPHIFHTNLNEVFEYLSQFTEWIPYEHRVRCMVEGKSYPFPINRSTINALFGLKLETEEEVEAFYASQREPITNPTNAEERVLATLGRKLYETFYESYTKKQWGIDPKELNAQVTARIPYRLNNDDRYFQDRYQMMPKDGYTAMFKKMLDHPLIQVQLNCDYFQLPSSISYKHLIYTGPIDQFFNYCYGPLPYRSVKFSLKTLDQDSAQEVGTVNFPNDHDYTRCTEFKKLTGQQTDKTTIAYEYPDTPENCDNELYYPIPTKNSDALYKRYSLLAHQLKNVSFLGRLGDFKYYNMDHAVMRALKFFKNELSHHE